jgi:hypothetical protein
MIFAGLRLTANKLAHVTLYAGGKSQMCKVSKCYLFELALRQRAKELTYLHDSLSISVSSKI